MSFSSTSLPAPWYHIDKVCCAWAAEAQAMIAAEAAKVNIFIAFPP
jgi:hypothetical protein